MIAAPIMSVATIVVGGVFGKSDVRVGSMVTFSIGMFSAYDAT